MVGEIINDGDAGRLSDDLLPARRAAITGQPGTDRRRIDAEFPAQHIHSRRVEGVHRTWNRDPQFSFTAPLPLYGKVSPVARFPQVDRLPAIASPVPIRHQPVSADAADRVQEMRIVDTTHQRRPGRHDFREATERGLHVFDVPVDIGVIELDAGQDHS